MQVGARVVRDFDGVDYTGTVGPRARYQYLYQFEMNPCLLHLQIELTSRVPNGRVHHRYS